MGKRVTHAHLAGVVTALALVSSPATAQSGGSAAMAARRDSCYTAITGDTAKLSAKIAKATAAGSTMQEASRSAMAGVDSTKRRAIMACSRSTAAKTGTSGGEVAVARRAASETRIPVQKEIGAGPARDTVIAAPEPPPPPPAPEPPPPPPPAPDTNTYTPPPPMVVKHYGNFYVGFNAGAAIPTGFLNDNYNTGVNFNLPIGWETVHSIVGARLNFGYSKFQTHDTFNPRAVLTPSGVIVTSLPALDDIQIWSGMADVTVRLPFLGQWGGPMNGMYLLGGGGFNTFRDWSSNIARTNPELLFGNTTFDNESVTKGALNAGGGFSWGLGVADIFAEGRYVWAYTPNHTSGYVPVTIGVALRY